MICVRHCLLTCGNLTKYYNVTTDKIKYGMINLRCNGDDIIMAQMKEVLFGTSVWDLYDKFIAL